MKNKKNAIRITKLGVERLEKLIMSDKVNPYHKTLLKGIKTRMPKNVSRTDCFVFEEVSRQYGGII